MDVTFTNPGAASTDAAGRNSLKHTVFRRFRQFSALANSLKSRYPGVPSLPGKHMFASRTNEFLAKRQGELDAFLRGVMSSPFAASSVDLGAFLGLGEPLANAEAKAKAKFRRPGEPVLASLSRGLGEVVYETQSLCPACVVVDRRGRGASWRRGVVARCDNVSIFRCHAALLILLWFSR